MTAPVADRPALLRHLLAAEWIKLWSLRSTAWLLGLGALMVVGMSAVASVRTVQTWPTLDPLAQAQFEPLTDMLTLAVLALPIVAGCVGALSVVGEYATGMIRTTFIA